MIQSLKLEREASWQRFKVWSKLRTTTLLRELGSWVCWGSVMDHKWEGTQHADHKGKGDLGAGCQSKQGLLYNSNRAPGSRRIAHKIYAYRLCNRNLHRSRLHATLSIQEDRRKGKGCRSCGRVELMVELGMEAGGDVKMHETASLLERGRCSRLR